MNVSKKLDALERLVSEITGVPLKRIRGTERDAESSRARSVIWALAHDNFPCTYTFIAKRSKRDHTTVISGCNKIRHTTLLKEVANEVKQRNPDLLKRWGL